MKITHKKVEQYLLSFPGAKLDYPFGEQVAVYNVVKGQTSHTPDAEGRGRMFALVAEKSDPVRLSLKCDPQLSETLRAKYETVMPGYHLNKKHWNTIVLTGQLDWDEITGLIRHSYQLVVGS